MSSAREMGSLLERERGLLGAFRDKQARVFGRLSEKFDPIVRRLVGLDAKERVTRAATDLSRTLTWAGIGEQQRSTLWKW